MLRRAKVDVTVHGFRSSFRDWAGDSTAFARDVVEAALAHAIENKTEAAYRRCDALEKRRKLMAAWAAYCRSARRKARQRHAAAANEGAGSVIRGAGLAAIGAS